MLSKGEDTYTQTFSVDRDSGLGAPTGFMSHVYLGAGPSSVYSAHGYHDANVELRNVRYTDLSSCAPTSVPTPSPTSQPTLQPLPQPTPQPTPAPSSSVPPSPVPTGTDTVSLRVSVLVEGADVAMLEDHPDSLARALLNSSAFGGAHSWHHADLSAEKPGSCQDWRDAGADADGLFFIFPANDTFHEVHCDQITDGGGWMLTWAYTHASGSDGNLNSPSIPLNPWTSYGNFFLHDYRKLLWFHGDLLAMNESNVFWI